MLLSQIALLVLIVMAIALGYVPLWLGIVVLAVWAASKLVSRQIIKQLEDAGLREHRMTGARVHTHEVRHADQDELRAMDIEPEPNAKYCWLELTITPPSQQVLWNPHDLTVFNPPMQSPDDPERCLLERLVVHAAAGETAPERVRGPLRLQLLIGAHASSRDCLLSYRHEALATIPLPA
jgi:hypothetical protein